MQVLGVKGAPLDVCTKLREALDQFLVVEIHSKDADERTKRDDLIVAACDTLDQLLIVHQARRHATAPDATRDRVDDGVASVLRSYNEVNREYDLRDADVDLAEKLRKGRNGAK